MKTQYDIEPYLIASRNLLIQKARAQGLKDAQIARIFKLNRSTVSRIV